MHVVNTLSRGQRFAAAADSVVTPTYVPHLCNTVLDLLIDGAEGIWHLANDEALSWADFAVRVAEATGLDTSLIDAVPGESLGWKARRPANAALASERGVVMPSFARALEAFAQNIARSRATEHRTAA